MPTLESTSTNEVTPPVKLTIEGEFWDSQIYSGILTLFTSDRRLLRLDWRSFVTALPIVPQLKIAGEIAFLGNRALYDTGARLLLRDPEIRELLVQKFIDLAEQEYSWPEDALKWLSENDNRFPFPHSDSDFHYHTLYIGSRHGVHSLSASSPMPMTHSDVPALNLAVKFQTVAYAAGQEGLYEVEETRSERRISEKPCVRCEWTYASIIASGPNAELYVAEFDRSRQRQIGTTRTGMTRRLERVITDDELFEESPQSKVGLTWGARNRLFRFSDGQIEVVNCTSKSESRTRKKGLRFNSQGKVQAADRMTLDSVISARVAPFGSVIELHDGLLVIPTKGESIFLPGEPINWRVFPRSSDYLNHLHVVYEDHLDVIAFTHDYFVRDQSSKMIGFSVGSDDTEDL